MTTDNKVGKEIGRKLSVAELGYDKPAIQQLVLADRENEIFIARFVGMANGLKPYVNQKNETQFGLLGAFEGTGRDGQIADGTLLYLPGYVQDAIAAALSSESDVSVEVAVDVYAYYDADAATSYVFVARNLIEVKNPVVEALKAKVSAMPLPSLPAPAKK
jgi:hypothetical protein